MTLVFRLIVVLGPLASVPVVSEKGAAIVKAMTGNGHFPTPTVPLVTVTSHLADLGTAQAATKMGTRGTVPVRNQKLGIVQRDLRHLRDYVQFISDNADPAEAAAIIESAGMSYRKAKPRGPRGFEIREAGPSGAVYVTAPAAGPGSSFQWQWSADGKTWTSAASTTRGFTTITGLTPGMTHWFRYRTTTPKGESDWSEPRSFLVK